MVPLSSQSSSFTEFRPSTTTPSEALAVSVAPFTAMSAVE